MDTLNKWLTLIANLAIVLSIVFLGIEIHQNTNVARASAYRELTQDIASWRTVFATHPELNKAYTNRLVNRPNSDSDRAALSWLNNNIMGSYENAYFYWQLGIIGDNQWQRFQKGACIHWKEQDRQTYKSPYLSDEFQNYMRKTCVKR